MLLSSLPAKVLGLVLAALTALLNLFPSNLLAMGDKGTPALLQKTGDFIAGVCHPQPDFEKLHDAGLGWIRVDLPFPYLPDGTENPYYGYWKEAAAVYAENGIRVFAVTPYPKAYFECGIDVRTPEGEEKVRKIARFYAEDLQGVVGALQITNEMGVARFTSPLTIDEAARFIGIQLEAMAPVKDDIITGYNLGGEGILKLPFRMNRYKAYIDYVGADLYIGSFENLLKNIDLNFVILNLIRLATGKPILLTEFGYISYGEPKTEEEKNAILRQYGFENEAAARADVDTFISRLPEKLRDEFTQLYGDRTEKEKGSLLFKGEYANHIYCELSAGTGLYGYPHTPEGQAKYYKKMLGRLQKIKWCAGAIVYMWNDTPACYVCGQANCPVETGWGLLDGEGNPKPAYYAVQEALASDGN